MTDHSIYQIPLEDIIPSKYNRKIGGFDSEKLEQLAQSIREIGVQQPAVVRCIADGKYELVAGERRWRASSLAGIPTLPCVIKDLDDQAALRIQVVENLQREDVHPLDEAQGFLQLKAEGHCEVQYIAQQVGKSPAYVYQRMKLHDLISPAKNAFISQKISLGHALLIARLPKSQQSDALDLMESRYGDTLSVREFDEAIRREILMELSTAAWKLDDAELYPLAGSCKDCSKRSGASPLLFEDIGKKDICLDKECFMEKRALLIESRKEQIKDEAHIIVKQVYEQSSNHSAVLNPYEWTECRKKDPGAVRALIVNGPQAGRLTWGVSLTSGGKKITTPEEKEERAKEKKLLKAGIELRETLFDVITLSVTEKIPEALLIEIVKLEWDQMHWDAKRLLSKKLEFKARPGKYQDDRYQGDFEEYIEGMTRQQLEALRVKMLYAGYLHLSNTDYLRLNPAFVTAANIALTSRPCAAGKDVEAVIADIAKAHGLAPDELNPPPRNYEDMEDDEEDEGEDYEEEETYP